MEDSLSSKTKSYISSEFEVEDYNVVLDVDKDNKVDVTETVTINIPISWFFTTFSISILTSFSLFTIIDFIPDSFNPHSCI